MPRIRIDRTRFGEAALKPSVRRPGQLRAGNGDDPVKLGGLLQRAQRAGQFKEFCASRALHTRKAYELIRIAEAVQRKLLTPADVMDIGWTKAAVVARAASDGPTRQAIAYARKYTLPALVRFLRDGEATHGRAAQALITKSFHLTAAEAAVMRIIFCGRTYSRCTDP